MKKKTRRSNKTSVSNNSGEIDLNLKREDREQPPVSSHAKSDNECTTEVFPSGNVEYDTSSTTSSREMGYPEDVIPCKQVTEAETDLVCSCVESAALSPNDFNSVLSNSRQEKNIHTNSIPDPAQVAGVTETKSDACGTPERTSFVTPRTASQVSTTAAPGSPVLDATERVFPLPDVNKELVQVEHLSPDDDAIKRNPELERLRKQLEVMASRLLTTQNQVDQLLEEKRVWIDTTSSLSSERRQNPGVGGELRGRWLQAKNQAETYKREKENMVIKYAQSEQKRLNLESRLKQLEMKLSKQATADKPGEFVDQVKSGSNGGPTALSKQSSDEQDFRDRLLQTEKSLSEAREQIESLTKGRTSDAVRIGTLESKLMISQDTLRSEQRKSAAQLENIARLNRSLEAAIKQAKDADRLREREAERLCTELAYKEAQEQIRRITGENKELREQISSLEPLKSQLEQSEKRAAELTVENGRIRDLQEEVEAGKLREDHLSEFARRLTERNANLQSEHLVILTRLDEAERKLKENEEFTSKSVSETSETLSERMIQIKDLKEQLDCFKHKLLEKEKCEEDLRLKLADEKEQAELTRRRDAGRIRDLVRQLARASQNRCSLTDGPCNHTEANTGSVANADETASVDKLSIGSHTSSLHSVELTNEAPDLVKRPILGNPLLVVGDRTKNESCMTSDHNNCDELSDEQPFDEPERAAFIAKLDRLQHSQIRLTDKVEFLQEHCYELTEEVNKKSQLIQHLLTLADKYCGAVSPSSVDAHKERIARTGGLMASLYTGHSTKHEPDRDICLEINHKLQNLLEDTLFKNITLKENMSTLGLEISSLTKFIEEMKSRLCPTCKQAVSQIKKVTENAFKTVPGTPPVSSSRIIPDPPIFFGGGMNA